MQDINTVAFTARLTADPELRSTGSGRSVSTLRVAIQRVAGKDSTDRGAAFYGVEVWNTLAETWVAVQGRLEHREWSGEDDRSHQRNYVVADQVRFLDPSPEGEEPEAEN
ncbi:MAG: single-stranded DNA-binding protein [Solirubrobacterales bacterium]